MPFLKIDDIVNVVVSTAAAATPRDGFNIGLIVGKSTHIPASERCRVYGGLSAMTDDGFLESEPEYKAAKLYFAQNPTPGKLVVGVCGTSETWVAAITACKAANSQWYGVYIASEGAAALKAADHQAIAAYIETIRAAYFFDDATAADKTNVDSDVFSLLKKQSIHRSVGLYSATAYAGAALMGFAMGANDGTANSAYTLAYKSLIGVTPDALTENEVTLLAGKNANYYITRGGTYNVMEKGVTADSTWFDELIGLDQLANDMQLACMDLLANTKTKIPYTDAGAMQFVLACNEACDDAVTRGFLAPGIWRGAPVLELETGDALEAGYKCQAESVADQSAASKSLRICPPIYVCAILAGAIHSVTIKVNVE